MVRRTAGSRDVSVACRADVTPQHGGRSDATLARLEQVFCVELEEVETEEGGARRDARASMGT